MGLAKAILPLELHYDDFAHKIIGFHSMKTPRVYNFSAGPAVLPESVLKRAQDELVSLPGLGMSILEISHRSDEFTEILESTKSNLRRLLSVPDNYHILFLQGGGRLQFSMIPLNLSVQGKPANYVVTGSWSQKAEEEARRLVETRLAWNGSGGKFTNVPADRELSEAANGSFLYYTSNETIQGVQFPTEPEVGDVPLVCDSSSDFLCRPLDVKKYGLVYACAQKNAGPAGVTIVLVRDDLLQRAGDTLPGYMDYRNHVKENSMYNTPPTFAIYIVHYITEWLIQEVGGLEAIHDQNKKKSAMLYDVIDRSDGFYVGHADQACRSIMNVTVRLGSDDVQNRFLQEAKEHRLVNLEGHRSVGGIRASIYNAMPIAGVEALRDFMRDFAERNA